MQEPNFKSTLRSVAAESRATEAKEWIDSVRILVVEDEHAMATLLQQGLEEEGHSVEIANDGQAALDLVLGSEFDVIVLDLMLPKMDGFEIVTRMRAAGRTTPVLMLSARDSKVEIAKGLDLGLDDYLTKPFSFVELLARVRSVARRGDHASPAVLQIDDLVLNPQARIVHRSGSEVRLSPIEFRLLEFLMRRTGRALPRRAIVEAIWGVDESVDENTLDVFISVLRSKLDRGTRTRLIHTVRGVGYCLRSGN